MGNAFRSNAYRNRSVEIPTDSPLFNDRRAAILNEEADKKSQLTQYDILMNTLREGNRVRSNSDSGYLCCRDRMGTNEPLNVSASV